MVRLCLRAQTQRTLYGPGRLTARHTAYRPHESVYAGKTRLAECLDFPPSYSTFLGMITIILCAAVFYLLLFYLYNVSSSTNCY